MGIKIFEGFVRLIHVLKFVCNAIIDFFLPWKQEQHLQVVEIEDPILCLAFSTCRLPPIAQSVAWLNSGITSRSRCFRFMNKYWDGLVLMLITVER